MKERSTFANSKYISAASLTRQRSAATTYLQTVMGKQRITNQTKKTLLIIK
jgi:hypothetical protein